jgi:hypothetical protein
MARRNRESEIGCQMALVALVAVVCIAGIPPLIDTVAQSLAQSKSDAALAAFACRVCGVVEEVREVNLGAPKHGVSTVSGEGFAMLLGLLSGKLGTGPVKIYEVAVRLQDGSVRVFREGTPSAWKPGDRVKVVMGRIESVS